jgi:alginate O-acetyltransferase complex protein AlgJ
MLLDFYKNLKKVYSFIFILVFWGISIIPILKPDVSITTLENKFLGHDLLIKEFNTLRLRLGDRVFPNVLVGKDGWWFFAGNRETDEFQGSNPYTPGALERNEQKLDALNSQLKQKGIRLVVVIGPDKGSIYPEDMPDQIVKIGNQTRLDQFVEYMKKNGTTPIIDLRPALIEASKTEQVFYKTDSHWNPLGQYVAYTQILSVLSQWYPELVPHPLSDYKIVNEGLDARDMVRNLGYPDVRENDFAIIPKFNTGANSRLVDLSDGRFIQLTWNQNQHLPSLLTYNDSFLIGVIPYLEPHFRQITSILPTDLPGIWNINWVDQAHPDIVILEFVERELNYDLNIPDNP